MSVIFRDRLNHKIEREQIYGEAVIQFLYENPFARPLLKLISKNPIFSRFYGWLQDRPHSKKNIEPFIKEYGIDSSEFEKSIDQFSTFNDFFTRKLKPNARPIGPGNNVAIIPADGRFLAIQNISTSDGFIVKGQTFNIEELIRDESLANQYKDGTMIMGRLCPTDYHRFHFPCDCTPSKPTLINGPLYSVNPIALKRNCRIFTENKRIYTQLATENFGKVLYIEIGATSVGTIVETFEPGRFYKKGDEKGYFAFGGSSLIILFEKDQIKLDDDLAATEDDKIELRCLMGQSLGTSQGTSRKTD